MYGWNSKTMKAAPLGTTSFLLLAAIAVCLLLFHLFGQWAVVFGGRTWVAFCIVAYLLFSPSLACSLYSLLFERPKLFGTAGLVLAGVTIATLRESWVLLDSLLLLPFFFLGAMGVVKFARWRTKKIDADLPQPSS
jgi:hypothetical protein